MPPPDHRATVVALLCPLFLAACGPEDAPPPAAPGTGASPAMPVTVVTLKAEAVTLERELPGRVSASLVAEVRPQANGIVKQRLFTEGSRVAAGQALYQIDDATYRADMESAKAARARAEATLESARLNAARSQDLVKIDAVSRQDHENAMAALKLAEADLAATRAAVDRAGVLLGYTRITSPIAGRIGKSAVTQGALVTANQAEPLAKVQRLDPVYIDVTQSSAEWLELRKQIAAGRLTSGNDVPVAIVLEDGTRYAAQGRLQFADVSVDPGPAASCSRRDSQPQGGAASRDGGPCSARERREAERGARPAAGDRARPEGQRQRDGRRWRREGNGTSREGDDAIGDRWLVEDGLAAGGRVVTEGLRKIRPGVTVAATEAGAPPATGSAPGSSPAAPPGGPAAPRGPAPAARP